MRFRHFIEETLRLEAPAHTLARICWLDYKQMQEFEKCHQAWSETGQGDNEEKLKKLITTMSNLTSVYPAARLHDPNSTGQNISPVQLGKTGLGMS